MQMFSNQDFAMDFLNRPNRLSHKNSQDFNFEDSTNNRNASFQNIYGQEYDQDEMIDQDYLK